MPDHKPKLLMFITNLGLGGAQRVFQDLSVALRDHCAVHEAVFNFHDGHDFPTGADVISLDVPGGPGLFNKLRNFRSRVVRLRSIKKELRPELCISHLEGADYVNVLIRVSERIILCVHGSKLHDRNIHGLQGLVRRKLLIPSLYNRADRIVTVSRDIRTELISMGVAAHRICVINNFFDVERIVQLSKEPLSAAEAKVYASGPVIVTSGRLHSQKNQAALLDVFAEVRRRQPAKLLLVGDGELRDALVHQAQGLGLRVFAGWTSDALTPDHDVYFMGLQKNPFKYIRPAALFAFTSDYEGFPLALSEAMICGTPVVLTDCATGPREILAPETSDPAFPIEAAEQGDYGLLMPMLNNPANRPAHVGVWVAAIDRLLLDTAERQRLGRRARQRMEAFTRDRIVPQWLDVIRDLLADRPSGAPR